jgi:hypothetical protein
LPASFSGSGSSDANAVRVGRAPSASSSPVFFTALSRSSSSDEDEPAGPDEEAGGGSAVPSSRSRTLLALFPVAAVAAAEYTEGDNEKPVRAGLPGEGNSRPSTGLAEAARSEFGLNLITGENAAEDRIGAPAAVFNGDRSGEPNPAVGARAGIGLENGAGGRVGEGVSARGGIFPACGGVPGREPGNELGWLTLAPAPKEPRART